MEEDLDPKVRNTLFLMFGTIVYIVAIYAILVRLKELSNNIIVLFTLTLLPLLGIFVMIWGYGLKFKAPGIDLEYYPVEKALKPASIISEDKTAIEAEEMMDKDNTDFINITSKEGLFQGIFTRADAFKARKNKKMKENLKNLMTSKEKVIHAFEREDLKSIMEKIGQTKHSRLPVLDKNNRLMGIIDSVDINELLSRLIK
jgi:CBS domain-containing protein